MLDALIAPLVADLVAVLGRQLVGLYLTGSAAAGGFDPQVSDIDLVTVVREGVDRLPLTDLSGVHERFVRANPGWSDRLEIVYVAAETLADDDRRDDPVAVISPGEPFHLTGPATDWLQNWYQLRSVGLPLAGPPPREIVREISPDEFVSAVRRYLDYLAGQSLESHGPGGLAYAVLSTCRALFTMETGGEQASKLEAALWVRAKTPRLATVIDAALAARRTGGADVFTPTERVTAIDFVRRSAAAKSLPQQQGDARSHERVSAEQDR